jgi:hypothetical protein
LEEAVAIFSYPPQRKLSDLLSQLTGFYAKDIQETERLADVLVLGMDIAPAYQKPMVIN